MTAYRKLTHRQALEAQRAIIAAGQEATPMHIVSHGLYLDRLGRQVGIVGSARMPASSEWKWLTTRGYYVMADGRAGKAGPTDADLVRDVTPSDSAVAGMDSTMAALR